MIKPKIETVLNHIREVYGVKYRNPNLKPFIISELYDLFPANNTKSSLCWPSQWPSCGKSGVYMFLNDEKEVLYFGEAVHIGQRLAKYCGSNDDKSCRLNPTDCWSEKPRYIVIIGIESESWFEYSSLEKYLINEFPTSDNKKGNR